MKCHLISHPFCVALYFIRVSMLLVLTFVLYGYLCSPNYHVTWSHFRCVCIYVVWVSLTLGVTSVLCGFLCCPSFYDTWSHFSAVWVFMLSEFLWYLVLLLFCVGLYFVRVSMSLGLTSVMCGSLCCLIFFTAFVLPLCSSLCYLLWQIVPF
jgi:hypothetical protein